MKTKYFNRYSYKELLKTATAAGATQEDIDTLGAWFEEYGTEYWNGEYCDADGARLFPVYKENEDGEFEVAGYEFR